MQITNPHTGGGKVFLQGALLGSRQINVFIVNAACSIAIVFVRCCVVNRLSFPNRDLSTRDALGSSD